MLLPIWPSMTDAEQHYMQGKKGLSCKHISSFFEWEREAFYYKAAELKTNSTSCSRTLDINDLEHEGPGKSPHGKTDRKWKAAAGSELPAPAASVAQPS